MKEMLLQRIQEIRAALEQSANNHNALIGRLAEAQFVFDSHMKMLADAEAKAKEEEMAKQECPAVAD